MQNIIHFLHCTWSPLGPGIAIDIAGVSGVSGVLPGVVPDVVGVELQSETFPGDACAGVVEPCAVSSSVAVANNLLLNIIVIHETLSFIIHLNIPISGRTNTYTRALAVGNDVRRL